MKALGGVTDCCALLFLLLTSASAVKKLDSIKDLKDIDFGKSVPKHSLILLHWFANTVEIDNNNNMMRMTFDPNTDYGSHHYGNFERILDPPPRGYRYFTVGNLNQETSVDLPDYVVSPPRGYVGDNRDRIIMRVWEQRLDQVYMTQHYTVSEHQGTTYDPVHTYQVSINLLRRIREFSMRNNQLPLVSLRHRYGSHADVNDIGNKWGNLACLGLLLFIVMEEKHSQNQRDNKPENRRSDNSRPGSSRQQNHFRPEIYRPEIYRPEIYRPEIYRPEIYRPEIYTENDAGELNSSPKCGLCVWLAGSLVTIILIIIIVLLTIFLTSA
ncbi:uncharacterized protein [Brachionichthys hirsutus]|uniref:uncharacterized protein n=1 Tax=Brachionichthys hirsutus TaxID=412623 RepID=UPI003604AB8D